MMRKRLLPLAAILVVLSIIGPAVTPAQPVSAAEPKCVVHPDEGWEMCEGGFYGYWEIHGGLPIFGYPMTDLMWIDEIQRSVQYTERQRFEAHPENQPPYHVLLGLLGTEDAQYRGLMERSEFQKSGQHTNAVIYFSETEHNITRQAFANYWSSHGLEFEGSPHDPKTFAESLALFGFPISEEFTDPETGLVTQYFQRAVFEYHPNNPDEYKVLLRRLGAELWEREQTPPDTGQTPPPSNGGDPVSDSPVHQHDTGSMPDLPVKLDHGAWTIHAASNIGDDPIVKQFMERIPDPDPKRWKVFPNRNNPEVPEFDVSKGGVEYGMADSPFCFSHPCDIVVPAWEYRYISGDYSFQGVKCTLEESDTGCMLLLVNVGGKSFTWRNQVVDNGFTVHGRYWSGDNLDQAIWALVSHGSANMLNMFTYGNNQEVLNSGYPGNAGANCGEPNGCSAVHVRVVVHAEGRILAVGETTVSQ